MPRRSGSPGVRRWSPVNHASVVPWGRRAPQSPSSPSFGAPARSNKIYKSDAVFPPGEARKKSQRTTSIPYIPPQGVNKIYKCDAVFPIGEANTNQANRSYLINSKPSAGRGGTPIPPYSLRKASTGSFLAASRAGMMPAIRVNAMLMHTRIAPPTGGRAARV